MNDTRWLTLLRLKRRLGIENATLTESDIARMDSALRAAQAEIEAATGRRFTPVQSTVSHFARSGQTALPLRDDLFALESVEDADGTVHLPGAVTWDAGCVALNPGGVFAGGEVRITGMWAHHPAPDLAFRQSSDATVGSVNSTTTSVTVGNAAGADIWGDTPRFTPGQLIRVESELMRVTAISSNTLSVLRGQNGTTAAAHSSGTPVEIYVPGYSVESLGLRLAGWLYREADAEHGRPYPHGIERGIQQLRRHTV